jgi:N-acetyl-anhydromuramyl-L-alanine amidase AmpD
MKPRAVVIHTAGVHGDSTSAAIRKFHVTVDDPETKAVEGNGWKDIGYHFVVRKDGTVEPGRPVTKYGAHTEGANDTIGICVTGDGDREPWTPAQWKSVAHLCSQHVTDATHVCGHREAPTRLGAKPTMKTCPGKLVDMDLVRGAVELALLVKS